MNRPQREAYARGVMQWGDIEIIGAVELRPSDNYPALRNELRRQLGRAIGEAAGFTEMLLAAAVESQLQNAWPDRAYFIEVGNNREGWVQVFQPYGVPRNDGNVIDDHEWILGVRVK